jgi:hypothetical protein
VRRQFDLPEEDAEHLNATGMPWETLVDQGTRWLLIHDFSIPAGYNHRVTTAALRLVSYPPGIIDMVYFMPALARADGKPITALSPIQIDRKEFQQWSRHYPWQAGEDTLETHLARVHAWLAREFEKR